MAAVGGINIVRRRSERKFRERKEFEDLSDEEIVRRYRLNRAAITDLLSRVNSKLARPTARSASISPLTQLLVCLRYLAKGDFLSEVADLHGISRSSACNIIGDVVDAINQTVHNIKFPEARQLMEVKQGFYEKCALPNIIGAIDGTLIPIQAPTNNPEVFVCRKGYHAINVQAVVDHRGRFTDVVAKWPGSTHDASIFENCGLKVHIEQNHIGYLLGDSGYRLESYLMTPLLRPTQPSEHRYNKAHVMGRNIVEKTFGLLKSRFRCLHKTGGCLILKPDKACKVIVACMRLHNLCCEWGVPVTEPIETEEQGEDVVDGREDVRAITVRADLIRLFES